MLRIIFIQPRAYFTPKALFSLEPIVFAKLKALTPDDIECKLYDERIENINYNETADLVAISINTMTALMGYKIAEKFREKGIRVIIGGLHANLIPEEVLEYADSVMVGEAEEIWGNVIEDLRANNLQRKYVAYKRADLVGIKVDRSIFKKKKYLPISHTEAARGCYFNCNFCALSVAYKQHVVFRPVDEVIEELKNTKTKLISFTDDNIGDNIEYRKELFTKMIPLKKWWFAQATITSLLNENFVKLLKKSGCIGVFVGFETTDIKTLKNMNKTTNTKIEEYEKAIDNCMRNKISVSAGAVVGYVGDTKESAQKVFDFINSYQFFICTISNLLLYPNTPIYKDMKASGKLIDKWWLKETNLFNIPHYKSDVFSPEELGSLGRNYFYEFLSYKNIFKRFFESKYSIDYKLKILTANLIFKHNLWAVR